MNINSIAESEFYEPALDGLRGLAILMVLFFHASLTATGRPYFSYFPSEVEHLSRGVQLFFIVSALTLFQSMTYRNRRERKASVKFYVRRFFRIFPLWWITTLLFTNIFSYSHPHPISRDLETAFFVFGFMKTGWIVSTISVGWSLFVELSFYALFPLWFYWLRGVRSSLLALAISLAVADLWLFHLSRFGIIDEFHFASISPLSNYFCFFLGISIFHLWKRLNQFSVSSKISWVLDFAALAGFIVIFFSGRIWGSLALIPMVLAALSPSTRIGRLARQKWLTRFGVCCYSIYLLHLLVIYYLQIIEKVYLSRFDLGRWPIEIQTLAFFLPLSLISLGVGWLSFKCVEKPFVNLGKRIIRGAGTSALAFPGAYNSPQRRVRE